MALEFLAALFGPRLKLPADQVTRPNAAAKKAAAPHAAAIQATLDKISGLPGIADMKETKRLPRGFTPLFKELLHAVDAYHDALRGPMGLTDAKRPGEPGGCNACFTAPVGVSAIEALNIYRVARPWKDFGEVVRALVELAQEQYKDVQAGATGKDAEKVRFGGKAVQNGRLTFAKKLHACPLLDASTQRCRVWNDRPITCRMQHPISPPEHSLPSHEGFPKSVRSKNLRLPVRAQVTLTQLDKRMGLELSPFLYASVPQIAQITEGQQLAEAGEAPVRMQQDGSVARPANRNVAHAKKFQKDKKKKSRKK
ncbi:MAG: YkgJ family cysteine cluster protein [Nannocystaceae bacterium]|nr:YkgJ family cysteine cluster protein [Nannocystaceae bacterium]